MEDRAKENRVAVGLGGRADVLIYGPASVPRGEGKLALAWSGRRPGKEQPHLLTSLWADR